MLSTLGWVGWTIHWLYGTVACALFAGLLGLAVGYTTGLPWRGLFVAGAVIGGVAALIGIPLDKYLELHPDERWLDALRNRAARFVAIPVVAAFAWLALYSCASQRSYGPSDPDEACSSRYTCP